MAHHQDDTNGGDGRGNDGSGGWVERREGPSTKLIVAGVVVAPRRVPAPERRDGEDPVPLPGRHLSAVLLLVVGAALGFVAGWLVAAARGRRRLERRARATLAGRRSRFDLPLLRERSHFNAYCAPPTALTLAAANAPSGPRNT